MTDNPDRVLADFREFFDRFEEDETSWGQGHVSVEQDGEHYLTGWVDVQHTGIQLAAKLNWVWTVNGNWDKAYDLDWDEVGGQPIEFGERMFALVNDPTTLYLPQEYAIHEVWVGYESIDQPEDAPKNLSVAKPLGGMLTQPEFHRLREHYDTVTKLRQHDDTPYTKAHYHVDNAWSTSDISRALEAWVKHFCNQDIAFTYDRGYAMGPHHARAVEAAEEYEAMTPEEREEALIPFEDLLDDE